MILALVIMFFFLVLLGAPFLTKQDAKLLICLGSTVSMILLFFCYRFFKYYFAESASSS